MNSYHAHTFHIPVMDIGYTIDTPLKVAPFGINSVISLVDDMLMEKMREFHSKKFNLPFQAITEKMEDFRAKRITAFLNMMDTLVKEKFEELKSAITEKKSAMNKYFDMLPDTSAIKQKFIQIRQNASIAELKKWINQNLNPGEIDVNIMTKLDKENFSANEKLPVEFNDAHAALRGFANSNLHSSIVLSAGLNPKLYSYFEQWDDLYPDNQGVIKKKVIIKVSDYRSAFVQGKFLAGKGIWVSEFRIESGLNCGGHAFATQGYLIGPILEEFKKNRKILCDNLFEVLTKALKAKNRVCPDIAPELKITAQGGVGTSEEHRFLLDYYGLDAVGWGSPFLLVPEAVNIDKHTRRLLSKAKENDLYLSNISPLGVPFNSLKGNTKDIEKEKLIRQGKPGSACIKQYCSLQGELTEKPVCAASRQYQKKKIDNLRLHITDPDLLKLEISKVTDKSCICVGLGTSALLVNHLDTRKEGAGVSVCPGPNMAYFSKTVSLRKMIDHIYGRTNLIRRKDRPNLFIKELELYIDYISDKIKNNNPATDLKQKDYLKTFIQNLDDGINYYKTLFSDAYSWFGIQKNTISRSLDRHQLQLKSLSDEFQG